MTVMAGKLMTHTETFWIGNSEEEVKEAAVEETKKD